VNDEYQALVAKVGAFTSAAFTRSGSHMACARGCDSCCLVWLSLNQVEAAELQSALSELPASTRARIAERGVRERAREAASTRDRDPSASASEPARCAMLEDTGDCAVYERRPLVCRTQGYALRYPAGFIPAAAVRARNPTGEVTHCPLNFTTGAPSREDVLDAERVDQILAIVNQRFSQARGLDPQARHAIHTLAADCALDVSK